MYEPAGTYEKPAVTIGQRRARMPEIRSASAGELGRHFVGDFHVGVDVLHVVVVFQKIDGSRLDPKDRYESDWFGGKEGAETALTAADGEAVVGVFGRAGADVDALGLVALKR